jgi:predicted nucleotide-binding protein (sugar kinase/HSP70/actin superfamily)
MKVFHGHVCWLRDKCDAIFIPRIMSVKEKEYICPKFCGLTEMVVNSIPDLPPLIGDPIYWTDDGKLFEWAQKTGSRITRDRRKLKEAFEDALLKHRSIKSGMNQDGYREKVLLLGHPYNVWDTFLNMDLIGKLNKLGVGIVTQETVGDSLIDEEVRKLFKKPFWTFARNSYGAAVHLYRNKKIDGIIYISSFACGIDSVVIELIRAETNDFPFMILKIDEHTGEAGFNTRIEAFTDMLGRRNALVSYNTAPGQCIPGYQGSF